MTTAPELLEPDDDDGLGECDAIVIVDDDEDELGADSASLSRWRIARNFL